MRVSVALVVRLPGDVPAVGARVRGVDHDALREAHRDWTGTTDRAGAVTWPDVEVGPFGNRFTFRVSYVDGTGQEWAAETDERIADPRTITITLDLA